MTFPLIFTFPRNLVLVVPNRGQNAVPANFSFVFAFRCPNTGENLGLDFFIRLRFHCSFFKQNFAVIFTKVPAGGLWRNHHNFSFRLFQCRNHVYSRIRNQLCVTRYPNVFSGFRLQGTFLTQFAYARCNDFITIFGIQKPTSKAWHGHVLGSGGHQTDSKPASVLANKPQ